MASRSTITRSSPRAATTCFISPRLHPDKGPANVIAVARATGHRLAMAGIVQYQAHFDRDIAPAIDGDRVVDRGPLGGAARLHALGSARALLHLIDFDEPFGLLVIEAFACGMPVIAMRRGAMAELIDHGVTGFLVDTLEQAADAVERVADLDRLACRAAVRARFSTDVMADRYLALYRSILG